MKKLIVEGRYDSIVTQLSRKILQVVKTSYEATKSPNGEFSGQQIYFKQGETVPPIDGDFKHIWFEEVENSTIPLEFYLSLKVQWVEGLNDFLVGGDAFNDTKRSSEEPPLIEVRFEMDPADYPGVLNEVAAELRDILRHEIEHVTQSGWNTIQSKYLPSDMAQRNKINSGQVSPKNYFLLKKEIPAMIQGLYNKAKKTKKPFRDVVTASLNRWVDNGTFSEQDKQDIIKVWRTYLPQLGIRQEL